MNRVGADPLPNLAADAVDGGVRLRQCDDGDRQLCDAAQEDAARLPIAIVSADENDPLALRELVEEEVGVRPHVVEQAVHLVVAGLEGSDEIDHVAGVGAERPSRAALEHRLRLVGKHGAQVVGNRRARLVHQPPRQPRAGAADRVRHGRRERGDAAIRGAENRAVVQRMARPPARHRVAAVDGARVDRDAIRSVRGSDSTPPENRCATCRARAAACSSRRRTPP